MYRNPKIDSRHRPVRLAAPSSLAGGVGTGTNARAINATTKVTMSMANTPAMPIAASARPARIGAPMVATDSASDNIPLARAYCSLRTIEPIAAAYAGNWKAAKAPVQAPSAYRCHTSSAPARYSASMTMVANPAPRSESAMTSLRFQRSTNAPATGLSNTEGPKVKKPTKANVVA